MVCDYSYFRKKDICYKFQSNFVLHCDKIRKIAAMLLWEMTFAHVKNLNKNEKNLQDYEQAKLVLINLISVLVYKLLSRCHRFPCL